MLFALSPTAIKMYHQCPYKFEQMYVKHTIQRTQSDAAARGDIIHKNMEASLKTGQFYYTDTKTIGAAQKFFKACTALQDAGWTLHIEESVAMSRDGKPTQYADKPPVSLLRCKIDVYATHPAHDFAVVIDWKTGKIWDEDTLQLHVNALCLQAHTGLQKYKMCFAYLDQDKIVEHSINLPEYPFAEYKNHVSTIDSKLSGLYFTVNNIEESFKDNLWIKRPNKFCQWCKAPLCSFR